jgi:hypothetical protein
MASFFRGGNKAPIQQNNAMLTEKEKDKTGGFINEYNNAGKTKAKTGGYGAYQADNQLDTYAQSSNYFNDRQP